MSTTNHHYNLRNRQTKRKRLDEPNQSIEENKEKETEYIAPDLKPALEESSDSECS